MKTNRLIVFALAALLAVYPLMSVSCSESPADTPATDQTSAADTTTDTPSDTSADTTPDSSETIIGTIFTFSDAGIGMTNEVSSGYKIDGTTLTIDEAGTYILTGSCQNGSVKVKKGTTGVTLVLNNLTLSGESTAPITCAKSSEVEIVVLGTSSLSDSEQNNDDNYPDNADAENAVMKFKDGSNVTLSGSGTLNITANGKNGIKSGATTDDEGEASLTIKELTLNINAPVNDAVNAEALLNILSGNITIDAADDALHCDYTLNVGSETTSPTITINSCYEGLEGAEINIYSGDIVIHATDDCINAANSDLNNYDFTMNFYGGNITADTTTGDGFDSNGSMTISGGNIVVWTANTADNEPLDADGVITITGGTVLAAGGSAGMGMNLSAEQPYVIFGNTSFGGFGRGGAQSISKGSTITISGGSEVYSGEALTNANYFFFSSNKLTEGESYTLKSGDSEIGTSTAATGSVTTGMGGFGGGGMGGGNFGGNRPGKGGMNGQDGNDGQTPPEKPDGDFTPGEMPDGFDPDNMPEMPDDFDPNNLPDDFDPDNMPEMPDGFDPGNKPDDAPEKPGESSASSDNKV